VRRTRRIGFNYELKIINYEKKWQNDSAINATLWLYHYLLSPRMHKKSFTLIEIVVVLVIIGILLAMIPWRLRGTQEQAKMALVMQQWEDLRQHTVIHMREWPAYKDATLVISNTWASAIYLSGWVVGLTEKVDFDTGMVVDFSGTILSLHAYDVSCAPAVTGFVITQNDYQSCYSIDPQTCRLDRLSCKRQ